MKERYHDLFKGESVLKSEIVEEGEVASHNVETLMREGQIIGQGVLPFEGKEEVLLWMPNRNGNRERHQDNLNRLHGCFYKGTYYHNGVGQPKKNGK